MILNHTIGVQLSASLPYFMKVISRKHFKNLVAKFLRLNPNHFELDYKNQEAIETLLLVVANGAKLEE